MTVKAPTRRCELALLKVARVVIGVDEVGRGALAGPVAVGAAAVDRDTKRAPVGLADSKLLSAGRREALVEPIKAWVSAYSVGWASPEEVSQLGLTAALRLAGRRALFVLRPRQELGGKVHVLLDGSHDWLSQGDLFSGGFDDSGFPEAPSWPVTTRVKADRDCSVVAAASVLAKVARDRYMMEIPDPGYDWAGNKGYASAAHVQALRTLGASQKHRVGWNLPGVDNAPASSKDKR